MALDIVLGRSKVDVQTFGTKGTVFLAKQYVKMGQTTSMSNNVFLDISTSHVVFVCGKRGSGKSYTLGVIAEGMVDQPKEVSKNLSIIMLDTMGIYWTMKYPNHQQVELLNEWGIEPKALDVRIYTPAGYYEKLKNAGYPTDFPFSLKPSELNITDWAITFGFTSNDPIGVLIERILNILIDKGKNYGLSDIIDILKSDEKSAPEVKAAAENHFVNAQHWGIFSENGTPLSELAKGGQVTVLDVSCYATLPNGWEIKALVIGLVSQKLFVQRMDARKIEELKNVEGVEHFYSREQKEEKQEMPLVWLVIDEAHEFLPVSGITAASKSLVTILREGRQPGISLMLATQQPGKIHTDVMTQSDIIISHMITAKLDTDALGLLMQSYMRHGLDKEYMNLPKIKGSAVIIDDNNERLYPVKIRPRFTWHGGSAPTAVRKNKKVFDF